MVSLNSFDTMRKSLQVGDTAQLQRAFSEADVQQYAALSGDYNPVHLDASYASNTQFKSRIVHGMLVGSLFSALLGKQLPGEGAIYMTQNIQFKAPVYFDTLVTASVEITEIHPRKPIVSLRAKCVDANGKILLLGEAVMFVPWLEREVVAEEVLKA